MADLQTTISNAVSTFGPAPPSRWNAYNWGSFVWGEGTADLAVSVLKVFLESISLDDVLTKELGRQITNELVPSSDASLEALSQGDYYRLFAGGTRNAESRVETSWSTDTSTSPTWTQGTASSTPGSAA